MDNSKYWNEVFSKQKGGKPEYDNWLDKYDDILVRSIELPIVDLGCGDGRDSIYLYEHGYDVIACDFSEEALKIVEKFLPKISKEKFNFKEGIPLDNNSVIIVVADLSLHYFDESDTFRIVKDIKRIIKKDGYLLCRINSTKELMNQDTENYIEVSHNFYKSQEGYKRFFDLVDIQLFFQGWTCEFCAEIELEKYGVKKVVWEICLKVNQ